MKKLIVFMFVILSVVSLQAKNDIKQVEKLIKEKLIEKIVKNVRDSGDIPVIDKSKRFDFLYTNNYKNVFRYDMTDNFDSRYIDKNWFYEYPSFKLSPVQNELCIEKSVKCDISKVFVVKDSLESIVTGGLDSLVTVLSKGFKNYNLFELDPHHTNTNRKVRMNIKVQSCQWVDVNDKVFVLFVATIITTQE